MNLKLKKEKLEGRVGSSEGPGDQEPSAACLTDAWHRSCEMKQSPSLPFLASSLSSGNISVSSGALRFSSKNKEYFFFMFSDYKTKK